MSFDKIKILWIEDEPDRGNPPRELGEYAEFFEVNCMCSGQNDAIKSINQYAVLIESHHVDKHQGIFPVEIVAADYDLSKHNPSGNIMGDKDLSDTNPNSILSVINQGEVSVVESKAVSRSACNPSEYDGCIINVQYITEFGKHPCGSVVTTYQSIEQRHKTVKCLEDYLKRAWGVDVSSNDCKARTWKNILETGVNALRRRIEHLYAAGEVIVSISDLMKLAEGPPKHEVLTIVSPLATRRLPVCGLFIDYNEKEQNTKIHKWVASLLGSHITKEQLSNSIKLENEIWGFYNDDILVDEMRELSELYINGDRESERYQSLKRKFNLAVDEGGYDQCRSNWCDIRHGDYTKEERRWASLFLIRKLLKRILLFIKNLNVKGKSPFGETTQKLCPAIDKYDIMLLLFPVPHTPFPLPWLISNAKDRANAFGTWQDTWMPNNLGYVPSEILRGEGISKPERQVLKSMAISDDHELGDSAEEILAMWQSYEPAKLFMFGRKEG